MHVLWTAEAIKVNPAWTLAGSTASWPVGGVREQRWAWRLHHGHLCSLLQMATIWSHESIPPTQQHWRWALSSHGNDHEWVPSTTVMTKKRKSTLLLTAFSRICTEEACKEFFLKGGKAVVSNTLQFVVKGKKNKSHKHVDPTALNRTDGAY